MQVEALKVSPQVVAVQVEAAKLASRIGLSLKCDHRIYHILRFGLCAGRTS